MRCQTIDLGKISHAVGFVPCEVKVITSGGDCESLDLTLFQLLYPRERKNQSNFTTETTMLLRALDKQKLKKKRNVHLISISYEPGIASILISFPFFC
jgi:hypothetical protein